MTPGVYWACARGNARSMNDLELRRILQTEAERKGRAVLMSLRLGEERKLTPSGGSAGVKFHPLTTRGRVY
jgi:hypothetical protein